MLVKAVAAGANIAFVEANDKLLSPWLVITGPYETPLTNYFISALRPDSHCSDNHLFGRGNIERVNSDTGTGSS